METRSMGWTIPLQSFMEKSGRQIAEDMFNKEGILCTITRVEADGSDGGNECFVVDVKLDKTNAAKWDAIFG